MKKLCIGLLFLFASAPIFGADPGGAEPPANPGANAPQPQGPGLDQTLNMLAGNWSGHASGRDENGNPTSWADTVSARPVLDGKFLEAKISSAKGGNGLPFSGVAFFTYDPSAKEYSLYLLDNSGFHGDFRGDRNGNTIAYAYADDSGSKIFMTFVIDDEAHYHLILEMQPPGKDRFQVWRDDYQKIASTSK